MLIVLVAIILGPVIGLLAWDRKGERVPGWLQLASFAWMCLGFILLPWLR